MAQNTWIRGEHYVSNEERAWHLALRDFARFSAWFWGTCSEYARFCPDCGIWSVLPHPHP